VIVHRNKEWRDGSGFTLLELLVVLSIIWILAGLAAPSLLRGRSVANETSALSSFRALHTAQLSYALSCGFGFYTSTYTALAAGPGNPLGFLTTDLTSSATPVKSGYNFTLVPGGGAVGGAADCNGSATTASGYYATAFPVTPGSSGTRTFATNQGGAIWQNTAGAPPAEPFAIGPGVTPVQ
jgi:prepilin-type N-terminal cleavage/methylation domain-containing protein